MPASTRLPKHAENLFQNIDQVRRLIEIHGEVAGTGIGYKHGVEVLNKSAIVLLVACWESFVEDIVSSAFDIILKNAQTHKVFPYCVLTLASKDLKDSKDGRLVWELAGRGWRKILRQHKRETLSKHIDTFNTPRAERVDSLFSNLIGLNRISSAWSWKGMSSAQSRKKLSDLITLRGDIAHRVAVSQRIYKAEVLDCTNFINRLAVETSNHTQRHIHKCTGIIPWALYIPNRID